MKFASKILIGAAFTAAMFSACADSSSGVSTNVNESNTPESSSSVTTSAPADTVWAGYFAGISGQQTEQWVSEHNIISIHEKDWGKYKGKTFRLRQNSNTIDAVVYDMCSDSDCDGCCTKNAGNLGFLIDVESYTCERLTGSKEGCDGVVEWTCLDCD